MTDFAKIDKYEVVEQIGEGSFGTVYKGRDPFLKRDVAIKVCTLDDEALRKRFFREAEIAGKLQHKNIVTVFAFGFEGEVPYLVQEYLPGRDLRQLIEERTPLPTVERLDDLLQIASGLAYAHGEGVIHRDIKPANVRRLAGGVIKIMDFGIAKLASAETQLTQKGVAMGTATYLPPEQVRGGEVDQRADIFSLGVLAYELLTFRRPFRGNTLSALVYQILYKPPAPISHAWNDCPEPLAKVIERCLEKDPDRRYPTAEDLIPELQAVRDEIAAGGWPAAEMPPLPPPAAAPSADPLPAVDSQARTVRIQAVETPAAERGPDESTRPIPIVPAGTPDRGTPDRGTPEVGSPDGVSREAEPAAAPPHSGSPAAGEPAVGAPEAGEPTAEPVLRDTAKEIQKLVVRGDLEAAQRELEKTIARQKAIEAAPGQQPLVRGPEPVEPVPTRRRRGVTPPAPLKKWWPAAAAAAAVLALVAVIGLVAGSGDRTVEPEPPPAPPPAPPAVESDPDPVTGAAAVNALPWAEVTEITDAEGFVRDLPEDVRTPLVLELPAGSYRITLRHPDHPELQTCELEVDASELASCNLSFSEPSALEYFKDSGWWK